MHVTETQRLAVAPPPCCALLAALSSGCSMHVCMSHVTTAHVHAQVVWPRKCHDHVSNVLYQLDLNVTKSQV